MDQNRPQFRILNAYEYDGLKKYTTASSGDGD